MLSILREISFKYNCYVFEHWLVPYNCYQIYSLDKDNLTECMKEINELFDLKWFSKLYKNNDIMGFSYLIEI